MDDNKYFLKTTNDKIAYTVVKTKRKTIGITINNNGEVKVSTPLYMSQKQIREIVQKKAAWIIKKVKMIREMNSNIVCRKFISGEKLLYLGKEYTLKVVERYLKTVEVFVRDNSIKVYIPERLSIDNKKQIIKEALIGWYRQSFTQVIKDKIKQYSLLLKVSPNKVVIKNQKTRWGSCSTKKNINLNWRLVMAPTYIIDYVVVHELCHLRIMNHSKDFWNLIKSILPNYLESREWLKVNGYKLTI